MEASAQSSDTAAALDAAKALSAALRMLGQREHSQSELVSKLRRKFPSLGDAQLDTVVNELLENDWLSDTRFAESLIRSRASRGYGPQYIARELAAKGINPELASAQLDAQDQDWLANAVNLVERRHAGAGESIDDWQRAARFLQRRGFPSDIIGRALGDRPYPD